MTNDKWQMKLHQTLNHFMQWFHPALNNWQIFKAIIQIHNFLFVSRAKMEQRNNQRFFDVSLYQFNSSVKAFSMYVSALDVIPQLLAGVHANCWINSLAHFISNTWSSYPRSGNRKHFPLYTHKPQRATERARERERERNVYIVYVHMWKMRTCIQIMDLIVVEERMRNCRRLSSGKPYLVLDKIYLIQNYIHWYQ